MKYLIEERRGEAICLLLLLATGIALLVGAAALPAPMFDPLGPAGLPRYIAYLMLVLLAVRLAALVREVGAETAERRRNMLGAGERGIPRAEGTDAPQFVKLLLVSLITLIYLAALTFGGIPFIWLTLVFLAALGAAMSDGSPRRLIAVAAIAVVLSFALTYIFTDVLSVVLPE
ncbi:tripartite tricarboxylate transporter TctB family protein [Paracoccus homiensis]|uniref:Tripartite tricarboxylate transporter TctB family protein n=1 Tax=Paracoccus homiensis TaxID=364199 RepID=A0A1I0ISM1_9RHOB|nr:tripartite tricarboxylate transporter TctB family protein [Paracoccus homiensis]SET99525.1 Tripartite tricarboxylate transporter TctB family protein [Paracoccus homiensis]